MYGVLSYIYAGNDPFFSAIGKAEGFVGSRRQSSSDKSRAKKKSSRREAPITRLYKYNLMMAMMPFWWQWIIIKILVSAIVCCWKKGTHPIVAAGWCLCYRQGEAQGLLRLDGGQFALVLEFVHFAFKFIASLIVIIRIGMMIWDVRVPERLELWARLLGLRLRWRNSLACAQKRCTEFHCCHRRERWMASQHGPACSLLSLFTHGAYFRAGKRTLTIFWECHAWQPIRRFEWRISSWLKCIIQIWIQMTSMRKRNFKNCRPRMLIFALIKTEIDTMRRVSPATKIPHRRRHRFTVTIWSGPKSCFRTSGWILDSKLTSRSWEVILGTPRGLWRCAITIS